MFPTRVRNVGVNSGISISISSARKKMTTSLASTISIATLDTRAKATAAKRCR